MQSLFADKAKIIAAAFLGLACGFVFLQTLPLANANPLFLFAMPAAFLALLLVLINVNAVLLIILCTRSLLDPLLEGTKISVMGENLGLGAVINLFIVFLAGCLILRSPSLLVKEKIHRYWLGYLAVCAAAMVYSPVHGRALKLLFNLVSYLGMFSIPLFLVQSGSDRKFWIKTLLIASIFPVMAANVDWAQGGHYYPDAGNRVQGTFSHPNILAFYLVFAITLAFLVMRTRELDLSKLTRGFLGFYMLNLVLLLLATKTRNAWISCWIFFFVFGLLKDRKILALSLLIPPLAVFHPAVQDRIRDLGHGQGSNVESNLNSFAWRVELWKRGLNYLGLNFLFGKGLASFRPLSPQFFQTEPGGSPAHNTYLEALFETGVLGLVAYLGIYWNAFMFFYRRIKTTIQQNSLQYAILAAYIASYIFSCAGDNMQDYLAFNWYFWFFAGVMVKSAMIYDKHENIRINHHSLV